MKKSTAIKSLLPISFLLLLLFLVPLFKDTIEYYCDYDLSKILAIPKVDCDGYFLDKYKAKVGNYSDEISSLDNSGNCIDKIEELIDTLNVWISIKNETSDDLQCELSVINEKISTITDLIKLKLISKDKCDIGYHEDSVLEGILSKLTSDIIKEDIRRFKISYPVNPNERDKLNNIINRATTCANESYDSADGLCCIEGDQGLGISGYKQISPSTYNIDDLTETLCNR